VPLSAYVWAFPRPFAFEAILLRSPMRLTDYSSYRPELERCKRSYFVPDFRFVMEVESPYPPGLSRVHPGQWTSCLALVSGPVLGQADNPRWLGLTNDGWRSSLSYSCPSLLDGIRGWIPRDHLLSPLHQVESQSHRWGIGCYPCTEGARIIKLDCFSLIHCTEVKLSRFS
jgi:hypothetical protein